MDFMVPTSEWKPPTELPDLVAMGVKRVSRDLETRDDGLAAGRGSGWATRAGYVAGVAVGWAGGALYVPLRHPDTECWDPEPVARWLRAMDAAGVEVVTQNGAYDQGWWGVPLAAGGLGLGYPERAQDTHAAAVMLDENRLSYKLDSLCLWQGLPGKDYSLLLEAGAALGCGTTQDKVMSNLWRMPGRYVGPYAEQDARATLELWDRLEPQLRRDEVWDAYRTEIEIMPLCVEMRRRGIRIDTDRAEQARGELRLKRDQALSACGIHFREGRTPVIDDVLSPRWVGRALDAVGVTGVPRTEKGNASYQSDWLEKHPHPLAQAIARARYYQMIEDKFLRGFLLDYCHRGRLHAEVNQLRDDDGGTRSHRFSYSDPPLQQMPSPKRGSAEAKAAGRLIRSCFLPEEGEEWYSCDYSQQEFRLMVSDAAALHLPKSDWAVAKYENDPSTDFHNVAVELTGLARPEAKDVNFAKAFGAGVNKFSEMTGRSPEESRRIMEQYDEELPFIKMLSDRCRKAADKRGYIKLIDGARCRFDLWEPGWGYEAPDENGVMRRKPWHLACDHETALRRAEKGSGHDWEGHTLKRAFTHKAMNRRIQGSAARQTKIAMRELWRAGVVPLLQMHDEINCSFGEAEAGVRLKRTMENAVRLNIPVKADLGAGPSWGELKGE